MQGIAQLNLDRGIRSEQSGIGVLQHAVGGGQGAPEFDETGLQLRRDAGVDVIHCLIDVLDRVVNRRQDLLDLVTDHLEWNLVDLVQNTRHLVLEIG